MDKKQDFEKWLKENSVPRYGGTSRWVSVRDLAEKISSMCRAEMAIMRTHFRKQTKWRSPQCVYSLSPLALVQCKNKRGFGKDGLFCKQHAKHLPAPQDLLMEDFKKRAAKKNIISEVYGTTSNGMALGSLKITQQLQKQFKVKK